MSCYRARSKVHVGRYIFLFNKLFQRVLKICKDSRLFHNYHTAHLRTRRVSLSLVLPSPSPSPTSRLHHLIIYALSTLLEELDGPAHNL